MKRLSVYLIALAVVVSLLLVACGGANSGKAVAQEMVRAMQAGDSAKLDELKKKFEELGTLQKVQFATEMAGQGEEIQKIMTKELGNILSQ